MLALRSRTLILGLLIAGCGPARPSTTRVDPTPRVASTHGTYAERRAAHKTALRERGPATDKWPNDPPPDGAKRIVYRSGDLELFGWLAMPPAHSNDKPKPPVLVYFHGGLYLDKGEFERCRPFLQAGFAVFTPTLRGRNGNAGAFELVYGEVDDAASAVKWIAAQPEIDPTRIHTFGHSMGGATSAMLSLRADVPVRSGGSSGGIYRAQTFRNWSSDPDARSLVRFDVDDPDEIELRLLGPFAKQLAHDHVAYLGTEEESFYAEAKIIESKAAGAKFEVEQVPGDHFSALDPALAKFLARIR